MQKTYQNQWFEIPFKSITNPSFKKLADQDFYDNFYKSFFEKFSSYDDLPSSYRKQKLAIASFIANQLQPDDSILSIGCGIGVIENALAQEHKLSLTAIEPSQKALKWLAQNPNVTTIPSYFPSPLLQNKKYSLIYACSIEYTLNNEDYLKFLRLIKQTDATHYLMISHSTYKPNFRSFLARLNALRCLHSMQFWGYLRTQKEQQNLLVQAGFKCLASGYLDKNTFWVKCTSSS